MEIQMWNIIEALLGLQSKRTVLTTATSALICGLQRGLREGRMIHSDSVSYGL